MDESLSQHCDSSKQKNTYNIYALNLVRTDFLKIKLRYFKIENALVSKISFFFCHNLKSHIGMI